MAFRLKTPPASEPITLQEAKDHLRVDSADDDALISALITTAREYCELTINRPLITQVWTYYADCLFGDVELKANLQSIVSIKHIDTDGVQQLVDSAKYTVDANSVIGVVYPSYNESWPYSRNVRNAIEIEFMAGYGNAADVPRSIGAAMLLLIGHYYQNREAVTVGVSITETPMAVDMLLNPYRVMSF